MFEVIVNMNTISTKKIYYNKYEVGTNDIPTKILIELAYYYDTNIDYLLGITEEKRPYKRNTKKDLDKNI